MKNATFKALARLIDLVLQHRVPVVSAVIGFTCVMAYLAAQIEVKTVFSDLLPSQPSLRGGEQPVQADPSVAPTWSASCWRWSRGMSSTPSC
jgi:hypothetical protein